MIALNGAVPALRRFDLEMWEYVWLEIKVAGGQHLLVGNYYLPPSMSSVKFGAVLLDFSSKLDPERYEIVIFGDFNITVTWYNPVDTSNRPSKALHLVNLFSFNGSSWAIYQQTPAVMYGRVSTNINKY